MTKYKTKYVTVTEFTLTIFIPETFDIFGQIGMIDILNLCLEISDDPDRIRCQWLTIRTTNNIGTGAGI